MQFMLSQCLSLLFFLTLPSLELLPQEVMIWILFPTFSTTLEEVCKLLGRKVPNQEDHTEGHIEGIDNRGRLKCWALFWMPWQVLKRNTRTKQLDKTSMQSLTLGKPSGRLLNWDTYHIPAGGDDISQHKSNLQSRSKNELSDVAYIETVRNQRLWMFSIGNQCVFLLKGNFCTSNWQDLRSRTFLFSFDIPALLWYGSAGIARVWVFLMCQKQIQKFKIKNKHIWLIRQLSAFNTLLIWKDANLILDIFQKKVFTTYFKAVSGRFATKWVLYLVKL